MAPPGHAAGRRPDLDTVFTINPDGSRNTIHPEPVRGRFQRRKQAIWLVLIAIYLALPWITIGGKPAVLIDIGRRHFYLFGKTFNAQDFWLAFFFVTGIGITLFVISALLGRIWCGYACPHTVFLEGVFRRIEKWIEGSPRARRQLDASPWNARKIVRRGGKFAAFLAVALLLAHTLLSYFMPVDEVFQAIVSPPSEHPTAFAFVLLLTGIVFFDFAWFREQLCIVICPYGRLQSALYDRHTINVGYDAGRGEPRGKERGPEQGDCIDCFRCVAVCPTGIDIRNGTQLECIGCADCIDACDEVMDRVGKPRGLIRYDSLAGLAGEPRRFVRPRMVLYTVLVLIGALVFTAAALRRTSFEANLLRLPTSPWTIEGDTVTNAFSLHLENKQPHAETFELAARAPDGIDVLISLPKVTLESLRDQRVPIFARFARQRFAPGTGFELVVRTAAEERVIVQPLLGPLRR
jgi:cytochrome c oxidase accessory protein FixG